ncbi:MAG: hypothetical protein AAF799_12525 [Myxococcota bacterium]
MGTVWALSGCSRPNPAFMADSGNAGGTGGDFGDMGVMTTGAMTSGADGRGGSMGGGDTQAVGTDGGVTTDGVDSQGFTDGASDEGLVDSSTTGMTGVLDDGPFDESTDSGGDTPFAVLYAVPDMPGYFAPGIPATGLERALLECDAALDLGLPVARCGPDAAVWPFISAPSYELAELLLLEPGFIDLEIRGPDGTTVVADDYLQLILGPLPVTRVEIMASGLAPGGVLQYWTGALADGTPDASCSDWSTTVGPGTVGSMDWGNSPIPAGWLATGTAECSGLRNLLCLCWEPLE